MDSELLLMMIAFVGAVSAVSLTLYAMRARSKKEKEPLEIGQETERPSSKVIRSVTSTEAKKARDELRLLDVEREILSYAIRRLYEAQAEGKINEEERERLTGGYKDRMLRIKDTISRSESIVSLHELETMQSDLVELFSDRFDEISGKIENLRSSLHLKPIKEIPAPSPTPSEKQSKKSRKPPVPRKTEAERRIEEIRAEVEKVLDRLGQIEVEG